MYLGILWLLCCSSSWHILFKSILSFNEITDDHLLQLGQILPFEPFSAVSSGNCVHRHVCEHVCMQYIFQINWSILMFLLQISVCYTQNGNCCITSTIGSMTSGHCILIKLDFECLFKILTFLQDFLILVCIHACSSSKGSIVSMVLVSSCCLWLCSYVPFSEKTFLLREECVCVIPLQLGWIFHS